MHLAKFLHTKSGRYIMSIILGFGLATLFRVVCKDKNCIVFQAPPMDEIQDKIFKHDGKCYKFDHVSSTCNSKKRSV